MRLGQIEAAELCANEARQVLDSQIFYIIVRILFIEGVPLVILDPVFERGNPLGQRRIRGRQVLLSECPLNISSSPTESSVPWYLFL